MKQGKHIVCGQLFCYIEIKDSFSVESCGKDTMEENIKKEMSGESSQKDRINKAYRITRNITEVKEEDINRIEAMLYAMADKFLDSVDLDKLKEEIAMTRLGQMIWEDGERKGREEGKASAYLEMIKAGYITETEAAKRLNISDKELRKLLEERVLM